MRQDVTFEIPTFEGLGLDGAAEAALSSFGISVRRAFEELNERGQDPANIIIQTDAGPISLRGLGDLLPHRGDVIPVYVSWSAAMMRRGYLICDGTNGTPRIHPRPQDSVKVQRFLRASLWGRSPGSTGGSSAHAHDEHLFGALIDAIANHADHTHLYSGDTCASGGCGSIRCGTGTLCSFSLVNHTHCISNEETDAGGGNGHAEAGGPGCYEHSTENHTPPYVDMIFLMKE